MGVAYQNANLFNRDQTLTLAYTGSADAPTGVKVDIFSLGYRIPFYSLGDSLDLIYGNSNVNTPSASPTLGGTLGIVGKGDVFGLRWNHNFARRGEYTSKLIYGVDYKFINSTCTTAGAPASIDPPTPPIAACVPYTTRPVSLTYSGQKQSPGQMYDYNIGIAHNFALGSRYTNLDGTTDRYSYLTPGNRSDARRLQHRAPGRQLPEGVQDRLASAPGGDRAVLGRPAGGGRAVRAGRGRPRCAALMSVR